MAERVPVKKHTRRLSSGKVITVKSHKREKPNTVCNHCGRYKDRCKCP